MKIKANFRQVAFDASLHGYFDSKAIYCLKSLCNSTNNKEAIDRQIPQSSNSLQVTWETRA